MKSIDNCSSYNVRNPNTNHYTSFAADNSAGEMEEDDVTEKTGSMGSSLLSGSSSSNHHGNHPSNGQRNESPRDSPRITEEEEEEEDSPNNNNNNESYTWSSSRALPKTTAASSSTEQRPDTFVEYTDPSFLDGSSSDNNDDDDDDDDDGSTSQQMEPPLLSSISVPLDPPPPLFSTNSRRRSVSPMSSATTMTSQRSLQRNNREFCRRWQEGSDDSLLTPTSISSMPVMPLSPGPTFSRRSRKRSISPLATPNRSITFARPTRLQELDPKLDNRAQRRMLKEDEFRLGPEGEAVNSPMPPLVSSVSVPINPAAFSYTSRRRSISPMHGSDEGLSPIPSGLRRPNITARRNEESTGSEALPPLQPSVSEPLSSLPPSIAYKPLLRPARRVAEVSEQFANENGTQGAPQKPESLQEEETAADQDTGDDFGDYEEYLKYTEPLADEPLSPSVSSPPSFSYKSKRRSVSPADTGSTRRRSILRSLSEQEMWRKDPPNSGEEGGCSSAVSEKKQPPSPLSWKKQLSSVSDGPAEKGGERKGLEKKQRSMPLTELEKPNIRQTKSDSMNNSGLSSKGEKNEGLHVVLAATKMPATVPDPSSPRRQLHRSSRRRSSISSKEPSSPIPGVTGNVGAFHATALAIGERPVWARRSTVSLSDSGSYDGQSRSWSRTTSSISLEGGSTDGEFSADSFDPLMDDANDLDTGEGAGEGMGGSFSEGDEEQQFGSSFFHIEVGGRRSLLSRYPNDFVNSRGFVIQASASFSLSSRSMESETEKKTSRGMIAMVIVGLLIAAAGVAVPLIFIGRGGDDNNEKIDDSIPQVPAQNQCDFNDPDNLVANDQPDILYQCNCSGGYIPVISSGTGENYDRLRDRISERLRPASQRKLADELYGSINKTLCDDIRTTALLELASRNSTDIEWYATTVLFSELGLKTYFGSKEKGWVLESYNASNSSTCHWPGILCDEDGASKELDLGNQGLSGSIPVEVGLLTDLEFIELSSNLALKGSIPTEIGLLSNLKFLSMHRCEHIEGTIPSEIGLMTLLEVFNVNLAPDLSGQIPTEVGNIRKLVWFSVEENSVTGPLPTELANLQSLETLQVRNNFLSGSIPSELVQLTSLRDLKLGGHNSFADRVFPSFLWEMKNLTVLDLQGLRLKDTINGESLANLSKLESIVLAGNRITGSLPSEIGLLTQLKMLVVRQNLIQSAIPTEIGLLNKLSMLDAYSNHLEGAIPTELNLLSNLKVLDLNNNGLLGGNLNPLCDIVPDAASVDFRRDNSAIECSCCI